MDEECITCGELNCRCEEILEANMADHAKELAFISEWLSSPDAKSAAKRLEENEREFEESANGSL